MTDDDPRHGTYAGYVAGCRCDRCGRANSRYHKALVCDHDRGIRRTIDGTGFWRRVHALQALGWPLSYICGQIGGQKQDLRPRHRKVTLARHRRMAELYVTLQDQRGPSERSRRYAAAQGWPPPIAWDLDTIDDPAVQPYAGQSVDVDPVVVARILAGDWRLRANRAERLEVLERFRQAGGTINELDRRTGWNCRRDMRQATELETREDVAA